MLGWADRMAARREPAPGAARRHLGPKGLTDMSWRDAVIYGLAQAWALMLA